MSVQNGSGIRAGHHISNAFKAGSAYSDVNRALPSSQGSFGHFAALDLSALSEIAPVMRQM